MPCGPTCACRDEPRVECLAVVAPEAFGYFRDWCASGDPLKRRHVLNRSRLGLTSTPAPAEPPGLLRKAANFAAAAVEHVAAGMPPACDATINERLAECVVCPQYLAESSACRLCGCNMPLKVRWLEQKCPLGKW